MTVKMECCAEVCGEMQSIVALEGPLCCVSVRVFYCLAARAVSLGAAAALRDAPRCLALVTTVAKAAGSSDGDQALGKSEPHHVENLLDTFTTVESLNI
jgi:hypothetical protein